MAKPNQRPADKIERPLARLAQHGQRLAENSGLGARRPPPQRPHATWPSGRFGRDRFSPPWLKLFHWFFYALYRHCVIMAQSCFQFEARARSRRMTGVDVLRT